MRLRALLWSSCISAAMAVSAFAATSAATRECPAGKVSAESYTHDFKGEANAVFKDVQNDAQEALYHADQLEGFAQNGNISWESQAVQLDQVKGDINDIGAKLCRLETIRRVVAPWQQGAIDQIAMDARLMADNAQDAILFGGTHQHELWLATYRHNLDNLYNEAKGLTRSADHAVKYASVSKEYRGLRHDLEPQGSE